MCCYCLEFLTKRYCLYFQPIRLQLRRCHSGYSKNPHIRNSLFSKTPNFDKQVEKFLKTPVKKLKNINVIDITGHDVPYQLLRINHIPFYFENKLQINSTRNTLKYSAVQHCISVKPCQMLLCSMLFSKCM